MEHIKQRFTLGRQSSMAPPSQDSGDGSSGAMSLPEKLDMAMQLLFQASNGDADGIAALIKEGADVNMADFDDRTALHVAACEDHAQVVSLLLKNGANANARDRWGSTPLADAKHYGNKAVCEILEKAGAKLPESSRKVPMRVSNPADVPEYEINPADLSFLRRETPAQEEYRVAKWHGIMVYVKEIPGDLSNQPQIVANFREELALLQKLRHPNIVQFLGAVTQSTPMRIILEFSAGGELQGYLMKKKRLEAGKAVVYALDIARGLNYLHEWKPEAIIHRALKPRSILRDRMGCLKVADFYLGQILSGVARIQSDEKRFLGPSRPYIAPEILRGEAFDKSVDVYSFAMILYQMIEGVHPFADKREEEVLEAVAYKLERPSFRLKSKYYPDGLKELITQCWDETPANRPTFTDVIEELERIKPQCEKQSFWRRVLRTPKKSLSFRSLSLQY